MREGSGNIAPRIKASGARGPLPPQDACVHNSPAHPFIRILPEDKNVRGLMTSFCASAGRVRTRSISCRGLRMPLIPVLIGFCLLPASIDCQRAAEHLLSPGTMVTETSPSAKTITLDRHGLTLSTPGASSQVRVHGYLQADGRFFDTNLQGRQHSALLFRRVRPLVEGAFDNRIDFRFMPDFGEGNTVIQEAYAESPIGSAAGLRIGKFKSPIGLEVLRSDRDLTFPERSLASDLVPIRDLGAELEISLFRSTATCELGYFSSALDGENANFEWRGDGEGVARLFFRPFAPAPGSQDLGAGIAYSEGHRQNSLSNMKTIGQAAFFQFAPGVFADGPRRHISPQGYYFYKSFGLLAEYVVSDQAVAASSAHRSLSNRGWEISASLILTGEKNSYDGVQPAHPFEPAAGLRHLGAWEIAFRHSAVRADPNSFPRFASPVAAAQRASESAAEVNWYINRHTKILVDYEYTAFRMHADAVPRFSPERVAIPRIQLAF